MQHKNSESVFYDNSFSRNSLSTDNYYYALEQETET